LPGRVPETFGTVSDRGPDNRRAEAGGCSANEATSAPRNTAATAAACAACASSASSAATYGATSAGSAASAACASSTASAASYYHLGILLAGHINFFVENKERPQANVKDFLFIESELRWGIPQMYIRFRSNGSCCGRSARHCHGHADDSRNRYDLLQMFLRCPYVLLFCPWHS
jgi:hypothetical protein